MMKFLKIVIAVFAISTTSALAEYPEREVLGVVMWGAGGATDTVAERSTQQLKLNLENQL